MGQKMAREVLMGERRKVEGATSCWFTDSVNTAGWLMGWMSAKHARESTRAALDDASLAAETPYAFRRKECENGMGRMDPERSEQSR